MHFKKISLLSAAFLSLSMIVGCSGEKDYSASGNNIPEGVDHSFVPESDYGKMITNPTRGLEYVATGQNPDWTIHAVLTSMTYISPSHRNGVEMTATTDIDGSIVTFKGELEGKPLTLVLRPGPCKDATMTDDQKIIASLKIGAESYQGCSSVG